MLILKIHTKLYLHFVTYIYEMYNMKHAQHKHEKFIDKSYIFSGPVQYL